MNITNKTKYKLLETKKTYPNKSRKIISFTSPNRLIRTIFKNFSYKLSIDETQTLAKDWVKPR